MTQPHTKLGLAALTHRLRPYPTYKDSGTEWLGEIPAHWEVKRLRFTVTKCQNGVWGDEPDGVNDVVCVRVADFDRVAHTVQIASPTFRAVPPAIFRARRLRLGDLLLEKSGGGDNQPVGAVVLNRYDRPAICSNFISRVSVQDGFDPLHMTYVHAALYADGVNTRSIKQNTGIQNLDSDSYLNESFGFPKLSEQRAIAAFLDRETAKIDALVAKKERLIELLREKRSALITRAVTKGLDPNVPMRDSGIACLGRIPTHWHVKRVRDIADSLQTGPFGSQLHADDYTSNGMPVINPVNLVDGGLVPDWESTVDAAIRKRLQHHQLSGDDILFACRGEIGRCGLVTSQQEGWLCGTGCLRMRTKSGVAEALFLLYGFSTGGIRGWLEIESVGSTMQNLNTSIIGRIPVAIPDLHEQRDILEVVGLETARIDALMARIRAAIDRLKELRTALISAAVTGKIDVRDNATANSGTNS